MYLCKMADVHDPATRSYNMSQIKGKNTKPELLVRKFLHANGLRYRLHDKALPGKPDIVLPKYKTVIFVHGCYWHRHKNCKYASTPSTNEGFWNAKFAQNLKNDQKHQQSLLQSGWNVIIIWECHLKPTKYQETLNEYLIEKIREGSSEKTC